jgi:pilus assembly protein CpaC
VTARRITAAALLLVCSTTLGAQGTPPPQADVQGPPPQAPAADLTTPLAHRVVLTAGRSTVLDIDFDVTRIAVTNPAVADAVVVQPREILVDGKAAGTVSLIVWGGSGRRVVYDLTVEPAITTLQQRLQALFPGENIQVGVNDDAVILSGSVSNTTVMLKAGEIAEAAYSKAKVINLLQLPGEATSQQVMLQVRIAEVARRAVTELGINIFTGPGGEWVARSTTQQYAAAGFDQDQTTFSDFLNLFVFNNKYDVGVLIRALKQKGFFQSLAEPNLIAYNGQEASFLAGGEFPVPVVQGMTNSVTVQWKEFGIKLKFRPTMAGDVIRLRVEPEVSALDFSNAITLQGWRIPSLTTRRASTDVELRDGQSFAIAGLLSNEAQDTDSSIPILGSIPIIGALFRSKAERQEQTELMVLVTPRLVRPLNPDEVPPLPTTPARFLKSLPGEPGGLADAPPMKPGPAADPKKKAPEAKDDES